MRPRDPNESHNRGTRPLRQASWAPIPIQPGYAIVNARITWYSPDKSWQVAGYVTNLTDKLYYVGITDLLNNFGYAYGQVGRPREWGVSVRRTF